MATVRDNVTPVNMCGSDVIKAQPTKQWKSQNPDGRQKEDGNSHDWQERWQHTDEEENLPGKSAILCQYPVHSDTLWLKALVGYLRK